MSDDLITRLRSLARYEHDDLSVADEAADKIKRLLDSADSLRMVVADLIGEDSATWPRHGNAPLAIASIVALAVPLQTQRDEYRYVLREVRDRLQAAGRKAEECRELVVMIDEILRR